MNIVVDTDVVSFLFKNHPIGKRYDSDLAGRAGRRIECADAWIAATATLYDAPLVTHNRRDYLGVPGLSIVSHSDQARRVTPPGCAVRQCLRSPLPPHRRAAWRACCRVSRYR